MKVKLFSVYDDAVRAYKAPFAQLTKGEALRGWMDAVNNKELPFYKSPEDYALFEMGEFNDENGEITTHTIPLKVATAIEYLEKRQ